MSIACSEDHADIESDHTIAYSILERPALVAYPDFWYACHSAYAATVETKVGPASAACVQPEMKVE